MGLSITVLVSQSMGWPIVRLVGQWFIGGLVDGLIGWLFSMFVSRSCSRVFRLVGRSLVWSVEWLVVWLLGWLKGSNLEEIIRGQTWSIYPFEETQ